MDGQRRGGAGVLILSGDSTRPARVEDVHAVAARLPDAVLAHGPRGNPIYQVSNKSFVFFREPRPDAVDPDSGLRYDDVIVFWVASPSDKEALVGDPRSPFFTTRHFNGHPSVLLRGSRIGELALDELVEVIQDAWLARAPKRLARAWLEANSAGPETPKRGIEDG